MSTHAAKLMKVYDQARLMKIGDPVRFGGVVPSIASIQKIVRTFRHPTYGIFVGQQKIGKTAALLTIADMYADRPNFLVHYHAIEGNPYGMGERLTAGEAQVPMDNLEIGTTDEEHLRIDCAITRVEQQNFFFSFGAVTVEEILKEVEDSIHQSQEAWAQGQGGLEHPKVCLIIDYANRLRYWPLVNKTVEMERYISNQLQVLTGGQVTGEITAEQMLGVGGDYYTVWTANQVAKEERRQASVKKSMTMDSAKGSGSWQEDPDIIGVINYVYDKDKEVMEGIREISWIDRFGSGGLSVVDFQGGLARLQSYQTQGPEATPAF